MSVIKIVVFNYLKWGFLMKLNDVCLFVSKILHSEYITVHPVVFSQLCTFYHQGKLQGNSTNMDTTNIKTESV